MEPSRHWPAPKVIGRHRPEQGPVLVTIRYRIDPRHAREFIEAAHALSRIRRRDGAVDWGVFRDTADPARYVEMFITETWIEHLRLHERITVADRAV